MTNTPTPDVNGVMYTLDAVMANNGAWTHVEDAARDACVRYAIVVLETVDGAATGDRNPCEVCEAIDELKVLAGEPSS